MPADFWWVFNSVEDLRTESDVDAALTVVRSRLHELDLPDLVAFQHWLADQLDILNMGVLKAFPMKLNSGAELPQSDDSFLYTRCACVLAGRDTVGGMLADPDRFRDFLITPLLDAEELLYVAGEEYEERTGQRMKSVALPQ